MAESFALTEAVYYILLALNKPLHGYGIMQFAEEMSLGRVRLAPGTLYGALSSLCSRGWIRELPIESGSRRKEYVITEAGREALDAEFMRLKQLVSCGEKILGGDNT
ncbi:MAG: PadR family transcriptional regulator [Clostridia bacterium]|nr:PadR family transcriptional regulator [Clostridia bacterium]